MDKKRKCTFYVDEKVLETLKKLSKETRVPATQYVQEALLDLFKKYSKEE